LGLRLGLELGWHQYTSREYGGGSIPTQPFLALTRKPRKTRTAPTLAGSMPELHGSSVHVARSSEPYVDGEAYTFFPPLPASAPMPPRRPRRLGWSCSVLWIVDPWDTLLGELDRLSTSHPAAATPASWLTASGVSAAAELL
ncbi:hypothetical protein Vafri_12101, partial [Volvox africanus]